MIRIPHSILEYFGAPGSADLFAVAGWRLSRIIPAAAAESMVEGVPA
jgi:hypothetical protein